MSLEKIKEKILQDAKQEAKKIIEEQESKAAQLLSEESEKIDSFITESIKKLKRTVEEEKERTYSSLQFELNAKILREKNLQIESLFNGVKEYFSKLDKSAYLKLIEEKLRKCVSDSFTEIVFNEKDKKVIKQSFIDSIVKKEIPEHSLKISDETADISGGFILRGEKVLVDESIENIISILREEIEPEVARILFEGFKP